MQIQKPTRMNQKGCNLLTVFAAVLTGTLIFLNISCSDKKDFLQGIGICTSMDNNETVSNYGYSYIEEGVQRFLVPQKSEDEFNRIMEQAKDSKLPVTGCNLFIPASLKSVGPEADKPGILQYAETALRRAEIAGVKIIVYGSGGSRMIPEGFSREKAREQFVELCTEMAPLAAKYGVIVVLEPLNKTECNFINLVSEGGEIVKEVNHPNFRLLADIYHMKMEDENPESILMYGDLIKHVHIAEEKERAAPGTYKEDFRPYFETLKKISYRGCMSVECRWKDFETEALTAIESIREQLK